MAGTTHQSSLLSSPGGPTSAKFEHGLQLLNWLHSLFGYSKTSEALDDLRNVPEGFDASGTSHIVSRLLSRGRSLQVPEMQLSRYDANIRSHLSRLNERRDRNITLRYFQYMAALYVEVFLDYLATRPKSLLQSLNTFRSQPASGSSRPQAATPVFTASDLKKLALWMATGSGKTILLHINYMQYLTYFNDNLDNILLITPNEGMSAQHLEEMSLSGLACRRFHLDDPGSLADESGAVRVIEITKLVGERRGSGVTVPVEAFEGNNLIFVDEGHKGAGGEAWRAYRDVLSATGFTFEYSATFGQALAAARNEELTAEYSKAIVFDYSYRHFFRDGFGKDFSILNVREDSSVSQTDTLLLASMLSFYEQQRLYSSSLSELRDYHIEKPLWVFVGSKVNAVYTEHRRVQSDVLTVLLFLDRFLHDQDWAVGVIHSILDGSSGLTLQTGSDLFASRLLYLRECAVEPIDIYREILISIFHTQERGHICLCPLGRAEGEIGLRVSSTERYFGVIYVGDATQFLKLVAETSDHIVQMQDMITDSLFRSIGGTDTTVEVLIGAKKFMEGWNSWRVSNMGLLNIGRKEGSEIVQLFGRGVRLRGRGFSLRRSSTLPGLHPPHIEVLETLNVFSVRADYMSQFRKYLREEGLDLAERVEIPLRIRTDKDLLSKGLLIPRLPVQANFVQSHRMMLEVDSMVEVSVNLALAADSFDSVTGGDGPVGVHGGEEVCIRDELLEWVDWSRVWLEVIRYKEDQRFDNLVITMDELRNVFIAPDRGRRLRVFADRVVVNPVLFADLEQLHRMIVAVSCEYIRSYYRTRHEHWSTQNMVYRKLDASDSNFRDYVVTMAQGEDELLSGIVTLIEEADAIYRSDQVTLPTIYFDRHLFQPLLVQSDEKIVSTPIGLTDSERRFVSDLRSYWRSSEGLSATNSELFLLRNLGRGRGVGFFEGRGFYPDFILWIKENGKQRIVFVEPHGMIHAGPYRHDHKARLHERLAKLGESISARTGVYGVSLDSFIISATSYDDLHKVYDDGSWNIQKFADHHILFFDVGTGCEYIGRILRTKACQG